jgi:UDP-N-acetylmuramoyl-L-alanine---L-glutamate ligase
VRSHELAGRRVVVWGIGAEGRAAARTAMRSGAAGVIALVDGPDEIGTAAGDSSEASTAWARAGLAGVPVLRVEGEVPDADVLVLSPGVSRYRAEVVAAESRGVHVTNGTELYLAEHGGRTVAITGSKGKSTVTRLTAHLLAAAGREAVAAGNIGVALLDLLPDLPPEIRRGPLVVAEVSSYQAALVASPPRVAVLTALFPDHLPWHGGVQRYYADKLRVFAAQRPPPLERRASASAAPSTRAGAALVNGADPGVRGLLADPALSGAAAYAAADSRVRVVGLDEGPDRAVVMLADRPVLPLRRSRLPGAHNATNVAAAVAVLDALGVDVAGCAPRLEEALAGFAPLPHRLEPVASVRGVTFVDDSLATSAHAAVAACEAYAGRPLTLLAGGLDRGIDYAPLVDYLRRRAAVSPLTLVAMGPAGRRIAASVPEVPAEGTDDVADAVRIAAKLTPPGGVVLFSPAAPSPAEYGTYQRRSVAFAAAARDLRG